MNMHHSALIWAALLLGACSEPPARPAEVPPVADGSTASVVDWTRREVTLDYPGWEIAFCEGEGPFLCVARGGEPIGSVELMRLPVREHAVISNVLERSAESTGPPDMATIDSMSIVLDP